MVQGISCGRRFCFEKTSSRRLATFLTAARMFPRGKSAAGRSAGFFILKTDNIMKRVLSVRKVLAFAFLVGLCSCASTSQEKPGVSGRSSPGAQVARGAVHGLRYLIGVPLSLGVTVLGPIGGVPPSTGFQMLQDLHDFKLPD